MAAGGTLASQYVEFLLKGMDVVKAGFAQVRAGLGEVGNAIKDVTARVAATPVAIGAAVAGFNMLTSAARSWVQAGLAGTAQGQLLQLQMQFLSREIAGVFVPTINAVIRGLETVVNWFRSLSGDQQTAIRYFVEAAAVMVVVNQVLGRVTGAVIGFVASIVGGAAAAAGAILTTLIPAIGSLVMAIVTGSGIATAALGLASAGLTTILGVAAAVVSALASVGLAGATLGAGLAVGTSAGRSALRELWEGLQPIGAALAGVAAGLRNALAPVLSALGGAVGGVLQRLAGVLTDLLGRAGQVLDRLAGYAQRFGDALAGMLQGLNLEPLRELGAVALRVAGLVLDVFGRVAATIGQALGRVDAGPLLEIARAMGDAFERARPAILAVVTGLVEMGQTIGSAVLRYLAAAVPVWLRFGEVAMQVFANVAPVIRQVLGIVGTLGGALVDIALKIGTELAPVVLGIAATFVRWQTILAPVADVVWRIISALVHLGTNILGSLLTGALANLRAIFGVAFGGAGLSVKSVTEQLQVVAAWLQNVLPRAVEGFVHAFADGLQVLRPALLELFEDLVRVARGMERLGLVSAGTAAAITDVMKNTMHGLDQVIGHMRDFHVDLTDNAGTEAGAQRRKRAGAGNDRTDVRPQGGQFETAIDLWRRLQEAAIKQDIPQQQLDELRRIRENGERQADNSNPRVERSPVSLPGSDAPSRGPKRRR